MNSLYIVGKIQLWNKYIFHFTYISSAFLLIRTGKPGWEKRWGSLENNILLLYREESDANPIDTFDLNPAETDVTVHSAISSAELPNTASTDLLYVLKLEHEPLTTCWPRRCVSRMFDLVVVLNKALIYKLIFYRTKIKVSNEMFF